MLVFTAVIHTHKKHKHQRIKVNENVILPVLPFKSYSLSQRQPLVQQAGAMCNLDTGEKLESENSSYIL